MLASRPPEREPPLATALANPLPDILQPGLDLVFVGINPGLASAAKGHHYAGPGNHFWPLLREAGFVPEAFGYEDDRRALEHNIGLTNLVERPPRGLAYLSREVPRTGPSALRRGRGGKRAVPRRRRGRRRRGAGPRGGGRGGPVGCAGSGSQLRT